MLHAKIEPYSVIWLTDTAGQYGTLPQPSPPILWEGEWGAVRSMPPPDAYDCYLGTFYKKINADRMGPAVILRIFLQTFEEAISAQGYPASQAERVAASAGFQGK